MRGDAARAAVIGGGVIGLSIAWRLASSGCRVTVYDAAPEAREASWAAAGMLAPHHEAEAADDLWRLGVASLAAWPGFADALGGAAAVDHRARGGFIPALDADDLVTIAAKRAFLVTNGVDARWLEPADLRAREPAICADALGALLVPGAHVDPRRTLIALKNACAALAVELRYRSAVDDVRPHTVASAGSESRFDEVILASGAWTPQLARLAGIDLAGEPVKGQLIRFAAPDGELGHFVHSHHAYLVPRAGSGIVVGSTMVTAGFDRSEDPSAIARLAAQARVLVPGLVHAAIAETWTGLRPRLHGGRPLIGRVAPGLLIATGHFRNGILLAPITAEAIAAAVLGDAPPSISTAFAPQPAAIRAP